MIVEGTYTQTYFFQPENCKGLVLISSTPGQLKTETKERLQHAIHQIESDGLRAFVESDFRFDVAAENHHNLVLKQALFDMTEDQGAETGVAQLTAMMNFQGNFSDLSEVTCPTLLIRVHGKRTGIVDFEAWLSPYSQTCVF